MLQNYIHPAVFAVTFVSSAFYASDVMSNIYYGLLAALLLSILAATAIELIFNSGEKS